jgi:uncharacterized protein (TIGR02453 family)
MTALNKDNLNFLKLLQENNNREWFAEHKNNYVKNNSDVINFADEVLTLLKKHDHIETIDGKKAVYRIYRDIRFSKDKTPYKTHFAGYFKRATKLLRGGYYFHIQPGNSFVGGGFWNPNSEDLKRIRNTILEYGDELLDIINSKYFIENFGTLKGEQLKSAPKGFDKNHPFIELLRYKQFLLVKPFSDQEVLSPNFAVEVDNTYKAMRPFFDFMSEALTTNQNGEVIV